MPCFTHEVFEDHLRRRACGQLLEDIEEDYAEDVVILSEHPPILLGLEFLVAADIIDAVAVDLTYASCRRRRCRNSR